MEQAQPTALVVLVDDHHAPGDEEKQHSLAELVRDLLRKENIKVDGLVLTRSEYNEIHTVLNTAVIGGVDLVLTIGGVGTSVRDFTPEATEDLLDRGLPGISEALRSTALSSGCIDGAISRGISGISAGTLIVNLPSSKEAVINSMSKVFPLIKFALNEMARVDF